MSSFLQLATDIVQNVLNSYCAPRTRTDGGYAGASAPDTTVQFRARLEDNLSSFKPNNWSLDAVAKITLIDQGSLAYKNTYAGWVNLPLAGDAPAEVQAWQAEAKATGV